MWFGCVCLEGRGGEKEKQMQGMKEVDEHTNSLGHTHAYNFNCPARTTYFMQH